MENKKKEYKDYLSSKEWQDIRVEMILNSGYKCELCGSKRHPSHLDIHHITYDRLTAEEPKDLIVLCKGCHAAQHPEKDIPVKFVVNRKKFTKDYLSTGHSRKIVDKAKRRAKKIRKEMTESGLSKTEVNKIHWTDFVYDQDFKYLFDSGSLLTITKQMLGNLKSKNGGHSYTVLKLLGVEWPPHKDWQSKVIGADIQEGLYNLLLKIKNDYLKK